ncbi:MAG: exodeoxyribonuclease VII large subunit [Sedimentisphaerales bacterium]|nr:exodeoxyribonuclease VII large subunit [Sedimentisphaerales bacterium]
MTQGKFLFSDSDNQDDRTFHRQRDFFNSSSSKASSEPAQPKKTAKPEKPTKPADITTYSVSQLNRLIKIALTQHLPRKILLRGEISNLTQHGSGHLYFSLKDEDAVISAVMWRSAVAKLKFQPEDGLAVLATGRVDVYETRGQYQFYVDKLEPAGQGGLELAFRQLAQKLQAEGIFDPKHKKPIPRFPNTIAIVTSDTGAAIEDISKTLHRRYPIVRKILYPVTVQGPGAPRDIVRAIEYFNRHAAKLGGIDVMIVGRGGGSLEDLQAFNEESVARAIFASKIPIISAVGHEIDTSISDMVADQRAITPTAAAELAVPVLTEVLADVTQMQQRLHRAMTQRLQQAAQHLEGLRLRPWLQRPEEFILNKHQAVDELEARQNHSILERIHHAVNRLHQAGAVLNRIEPHVALATAQGQLHRWTQQLETAQQRYHQQARHTLDKYQLNLQAVSPASRARQGLAVLNQVAQRLQRGQEQLTRDSQSRLDNITARMRNLNPKAVLQRGYSITRNAVDKKIVTVDNPPQIGDELITELHDAWIINSQVEQIKKGKS